MTHIHAVIFDVDGTLVDSNDAQARSWVDALKEFGYSVPYEKVRPLIGMGGDKVLPETIGVQKDSERRIEAITANCRSGRSHRG